MDIKSFAKINLTLQIGGKRPDGFHSLRSITSCISLHDTLSVNLTDKGGIQFYSFDRTLPEKDNSAAKAARLFSQTYCPDLNAAIRLYKSIPIQAGLGGGSSNASAVLLALNKLTGINVPSEELARLSSKLGSDMPLFIYGGTCLMEGRGELITPLPDSFPLELIVLKPGTGIATGPAYSQLDMRQNITEPDSITSLPDSKEEYYQYALNDFSDPACRINREIPEAAALLKASGAEFTMLCGSGSAVFGVYSDRASRDNGWNYLLHKTIMTAYPCTTLTRREYFYQLFGEHA